MFFWLRKYGAGLAIVLTVIVVVLFAGAYAQSGEFEIPSMPAFDVVEFAGNPAALAAFLVGFTAFVRHFWLQGLDGIQVPIFVGALGLVIGALVGASPATEVAGFVPGIILGAQAAVMAILGHAGVKSAIGGNGAAQAVENDTRAAAARLQR